MNILTFDIEDWFHINFEKEFNNETSWNNFESRIENNTDVILDILDTKKIKATFFCLGWVARKYPNLIRKIYNLGHDVGSHSDIHNLITKQTEREFEEDLKKSINSLEDVLGKKIKIYRAPAFSIGKNNSWAFEKLIEQGIEIDCSVFPADHDFGGFKEMDFKGPFLIKQGSIILKEFPMSTYNILGKKTVLSGGGYFRFFPYRIIKHFINKSNYNMSYFHPRDLDADQPVLDNLGLIRMFKSYYGLKNSINKFQKLINDIKFLSVSEGDQLVHWKNVIQVDYNHLLK